MQTRHEMPAGIEMRLLAGPEMAGLPQPASSIEIIISGIRPEPGAAAPGRIALRLSPEQLAVLLEQAHRLLARAAPPPPPPPAGTDPLVLARLLRGLRTL